MWHRNGKVKKTDTFPELVFSSLDGSPWAAFPPNVVDPIRRSISRIGRKEAFPSRLSFVAALRGEGVSYISSAFATTMAHDLDVSVCLVDLNWWWPSEISTKESDSEGLGAVLKGSTTLSQAIVQTGKENLDVLPAGELSLQERAHFARSSVLKDAIRELSARYDHLVLDIPAVLASNDAIPLASLGTAFCLVIHQGVTSITEVKSTLSDLDHLPNIGVIMNKYKSAAPKSIQKLLSPL